MPDRIYHNMPDAGQTVATDARELAADIRELQSEYIIGGSWCKLSLAEAIERIERYVQSRLASARASSLDDFRADELDAVMHSVDKWFDEGDPRLKQSPANRAADAREIALKAIEARASSAEAGLREALRKLRDACAAEPAMNNMKYDALGLEVNRALDQSKGKI